MLPKDNEILLDTLIVGAFFQFYFAIFSFWQAIPEVSGSHQALVYVIASQLFLFLLFIFIFKAIVFLIEHALFPIKLDSFYPENLRSLSSLILIFLSISGIILSFQSDFAILLAPIYANSALAAFFFPKNPNYFGNHFLFLKSIAAAFSLTISILWWLFFAFISLHSVKTDLRVGFISILLCAFLWVVLRLFFRTRSLPFQLTSFPNQIEE